MAFDPNGNLKWRVGVNAQFYPVQGADGGFCYVDWPNVMYWMNDNSKAGWYNLTLLVAFDLVVLGLYAWTVLKKKKSSTALEQAPDKKKKGSRKK